MIKLRLFLFAIVVLPASVAAYDSGHPCIEDFLRFVAVVEEFGHGELKHPVYCKTERIEEGRPILYSRYCDESESVAVRAAIAIYDVEPLGMSCTASLDYGFYPSTDCLSNQQREVHRYAYSSEELYADAKAKITELCSAIGDAEMVDSGK